MVRGGRQNAFIIHNHHQSPISMVLYIYRDIYIYLGMGSTRFLGPLVKPVGELFQVEMQ